MLYSCIHKATVGVKGLTVTYSTVVDDSKRGTLLQHLRTV